MSCCNLWSAGEPCDCHIPTSPDPRDGRVWDKLNQAWVEGFVMTCAKPWLCTPANCTCGPFDLPAKEVFSEPAFVHPKYRVLTKDEHKQEVMIEDAENVAALKIRMKNAEELAEAYHRRCLQLDAEIVDLKERLRESRLPRS